MYSKIIVGYDGSAQADDALALGKLIAGVTGASLTAVTVLQFDPRWRGRDIHFQVVDLPRVVRAFRFSLDAMWAETSQLNLLELAPALQMPVFFFLGRNDHWVPPDVSVAYFEALTAPSKQLVWFEQSGHEPFADEPAKFNAAMAELIPPVLEPAPSAGAERVA